MDGVSVCTIVKGRERHFRNLIIGLCRGDAQPDELVIAYMQEAPAPDLPPAPFPIHEIMVPTIGPLPLAAGRNAAAAAARTETLIFLDVDCVPSPPLVEAYAKLVARDDVCAMGQTRYLDAAAEAGGPFEPLWDGATVHPARKVLNGTEPVPEPAHGEFWSLSFALRRRTFERMGGFDERFSGYGGEDTDFAHRLADHDVPLVWVPQARAVHQWHEVSVPPLQHFAHIVRNARLFHAIRGQWCMEYWLGQFAEAGYIEWSSDTLRVRRFPSGDECRAARQPPAILFS
jgi:hypothetical protein